MKHLTLLFSIFVMFNVSISYAAGEKNNTNNTKTYVIEKESIELDRSIEKHIKEIGELLDPLMLEDDPKAEFKKVIPNISKYSTVKKTYFKGNTFYVEFKNGSINYWDMPK